MSWPFFLQILVICVVSGLLFAGGAFFTALRAGNVLAPGATSTEAFRIGYKEYSLSTGNALVALIIIAAACMFLVPGLFWYTSSKIHDEPVYLESRFNPPAPAISISGENYPQTTDANLVIYRSSRDQHFTISYEKYYPISITAHYLWSKNELEVYVNNEQYNVPVNGSQAQLPPISWTRDTDAVKPVIVARPSRTKVVPASMHDLVDPLASSPSPL